MISPLRHSDFLILALVLFGLRKPYAPMVGADAKVARAAALKNRSVRAD